MNPKLRGAAILEPVSAVLLAIAIAMMLIGWVRPSLSGVFVALGNDRPSLDRPLLVFAVVLASLVCAVIVTRVARGKFNANGFVRWFAASLIVLVVLGAFSVFLPIYQAQDLVK